MTDLVAFIKDVGFPIAVAAWVLIRLNGKVGKLADAMTTLATTMERFIDHTASEAEKTRLRDDLRTTNAVRQVLEAVADKQ